MQAVSYIYCVFVLPMRSNQAAEPATSRLVYRISETTANKHIQLGTEYIAVLV